MHNMDNSQDELQYHKPARAGLIPYTFNAEGVPVYLMMISSDPKFGGPRPMISKGKIEIGEDELNCAIREAEEELGLVKRNMKSEPVQLAAEQVVLRSGTYFLTVFYVEIFDRLDFDKWCDETEYTLWMTCEQFKEEGRKDHVKYVVQLDNIIRNGHAA
jgi:8-oxo-dGTP pyrophosphatase MutT (NUDIX family)